LADLRQSQRKGNELGTYTNMFVQEKLASIVKRAYFCAKIQSYSAMVLEKELWHFTSKSR
jgi:conserved domain protein